MRVCFVSLEYPPNIIGGAGTYAAALVNGLKNNDVDVFTITRGEKNDYNQQTYRVPTSNATYWRRLFFVRSAMSLLHNLNKIRKFDVIHFNEPHLLPTKPNIPTVCTFHSLQVNEIKLKLPVLGALKTVNDIVDFALKGPVGTMCDLLTVHATDKIICPSFDLAKLIESYCFIDKQKIHVVPNGLDLEEFDKTKMYETRILSQYNLDKDNYILFMGRLSFFKGVEFLIKAFKAIKKEYPRLKLVIAGTGNFEEYLRKLACGTEDIVFTGFVKSLALRKSLYKNCFVVVIPSLYEGLPMVVLEAMASGKAVVASDVGDLPFLVKHGKNGFLAEPGNSKSLEGFIRTLFEDANLRQTMGSFGRKLVEKEFTVDIMVHKTLEAYKALCD